MAVNDGVVKMLHETYLRATEVGPGFSLGEEHRDETRAYIGSGLELLTELDDRSVYETLGALGELDAGALRLLATQAVVELRDLGYRLATFDPSDERQPI